MKENTNGYIYYDKHQKTEKEEIASTAWKSVFHWIYAIVGIFFVLVIVTAMFFRVVSVEGSSMLPTIKDGSALLVYSFDYEPQPGDIVVISSTENDFKSVKRIVALENQTVDINYEKGVICVDGVELQEDYILEMTKPADNETEFPYTVPEGCVFVMGDNRNESKDSRNNGIRGIDKNRIAGKVVAEFYPFGEFELFE